MMKKKWPDLPVYPQEDGRVLKAGFTTGTCAAAAAKAAVAWLFYGQSPSLVEVDTPAGIRLSLPVHRAERKEDSFLCSVKKFAGDDPDITDGLEIWAGAARAGESGIELLAGEGVGRVTRAGLSVPPGEAAINPVPREQICRAVREVLPPGCGVQVKISIPGGEELAQKTLNPQLGIVGGLSILGTTGIVEPMSSEAFKRSLLPQVDVALAAGQRHLVLVPGKMGKRNALKLLKIPEEAVVVTANFIGYMLKGCAARGVKQAVLLGHLGKVGKVAAGVADTHSAVADARREILVAHAALLGLAQEVCQALMSHNTAEESAVFLLDNGYGAVLEAVACAAAGRARQMAGGEMAVGCILLNLAGRVIGCDPIGAGILKEAKTSG